MDIIPLIPGTEDKCDELAGANTMDSWGRFCVKPVSEFETLMTPTVTEMASGGRLLKMFAGGAVRKNKIEPQPQLQQSDEVTEAVEELSAIVNEAKPTLNLPIAFEFMQYLAGKTGETSKFVDKFFKDKGLQLLPEAKDAIVREENLMQSEILTIGGIIRDTKVLDYSRYQDYKEAIEKRRAEGRTNSQDQWIAGHPAREIFVTRKPKTEWEIKLCDEIEDAINVIEEYYKGFTEKSVISAMIQTKERHYGGNKRIGIMIKAEPYAHQFTIAVMGIVGGYDIEISDRGSSMELDEDAHVYVKTKTYNNLPTKEDLIDDYCVMDLLASFPGKGIIQRDSTQSVVYPTAKELLETGYKAVGGNEVFPITKNEAIKLYNDGSVAGIMEKKIETNKELSPSAKNNYRTDYSNSITTTVQPKEEQIIETPIMEEKTETASPVVNLVEEDASQREEFYAKLNEAKTTYDETSNSKLPKEQIAKQLLGIANTIGDIVSAYPSLYPGIIKWNEGLPYKKKLDVIAFLENSRVKGWLKQNSVNVAHLIDLKRYPLPVAQEFKTASNDSGFMDIHTRFALTKKKDAEYDLRPAMTTINFDKYGVSSTDGHELLFTKYRGKSSERGMYAYTPESYETIKTENWSKRKPTDAEIKDAKGDISLAVQRLKKPGFIENPMVKIKDPTPEHLGGKGEIKDDKAYKFPHYKAVIPFTYGHVIPINTYALYNYLKNSFAANFYASDTCLFEFSYGKEEGKQTINFDGKLLFNAIEAMIEIGHSDMQFCLSGNTRALVVTENGVTGDQVKDLKVDIALVMPIMGEGHYNPSGIVYDLDNGCAYYPDSEPHCFTGETVVSFDEAREAKKVADEAAELDRIAKSKIIPISSEKKRNLASILSKVLSAKGTPISDKRRILALLNPTAAE